MTVKKCGGLWFWRIGRVGGSFYVSARPTYWESVLTYYPRNPSAFDAAIKIAAFGFGYAIAAAL